MRALSDSSGVEYTQLSKYASGDQKPGLDVLEKLQAAGVSIDWLLRGTGSMFANPTDMQSTRIAVESIPDEILVREALTRYNASLKSRGADDASKSK